jgi:PAS domain S-box-containing protein
MDAVLETLQHCPRRETCLTKFAVENAADAALWMDAAGTLLYVNQAACSLLGYGKEELLRAHASQISSELQARLDSHCDTERFEATCFSLDNREITVEISLARFAVDGCHFYAVFLHDISERKQLEQQLRQAHRMEAVGRLVDGVSHDFNNVLTAVMIYGGLLANQLTPESPLRKHANQILAAAEHGRNLISQLLGFGRAHAAEMRVSNISLAEMLGSMTEMLRHLVGEDVMLRVDCVPDLAPVMADRAALEQVVMNLVLNARDAMPDGGKLRITAENLGESRYSGAGTWVRMTVSDTGCGMDSKTLARVFEPFFTTKPKGRGSGLGLATVHRSVTDAGGKIEIQSRPGEGTKVIVLMPAGKPSIADRAVACDPECRGSETVLVVEDDELVRRSVYEILGQRGYQVLQAGDAREAREIAVEFSGRIHVLLTDLVLPQGSGAEVAAAITQIRPDIRVLYMSGYAENARVRQLLRSGQPFCTKPFTAATLARKLREVLAPTESVASAG